MDNRPASSRRENDRLPVDAGDHALDGALDSAIRAGLYDVAVPQGLLARLAAIPDEASDRDLPTPAKETVATPPGRISRRAAIYGGIALASAACLGLGVWLLESGTDFERWNEETLSRRAIAWTTYLEENSGTRDSWKPIDAERAERSLGQWVRVAPEAVGQYRLAGTHDRRFRGEVYRFGAAERSDAMLFVVGAATLPDDLPNSPPATPSWTSEGFAVGMWRRGGKLYVVAVRGDARDYAQLIRRQTVA